MRLNVQIDPSCGETTVTVTAPEMTEEVRDLVRCLSAQEPLLGWRDGAAVPLDLSELLRVYTANREVWAQTERGEFLLKQRLYELEQRLDPADYVRISHSEMIDLRKVTALDLSLAGTIRVTLAGGTVCYVSRRYVKKIKEALGLRREGRS